MREITLKTNPYRDEKEREVPAHSIGIVQTSAYGNHRSDLTVVRIGKSVHFSEEKDTDALTVNWSNAVMGVKTALRAFERALTDSEYTSTPTRSGYAERGARLILARKGKRLYFTAPCGAEGYMTVAEAEKLVALLRSWT